MKKLLPLKLLYLLALSCPLICSDNLENQSIPKKKEFHCRKAETAKIIAAFAGSAFFATAAIMTPNMKARIQAQFPTTKRHCPAELVGAGVIVFIKKFINTNKFGKSFLFNLWTGLTVGTSLSISAALALYACRKLYLLKSTPTKPHDRH